LKAASESLVEAVASVAGTAGLFFGVEGVGLAVAGFFASAAAGASDFSGELAAGCFGFAAGALALVPAAVAGAGASDFFSSFALAGAFAPELAEGVFAAGVFAAGSLAVGSAALLSVLSLAGALAAGGLDF
jgi:hypothetical protein